MAQKKHVHNGLKTPAENSKQSKKEEGLVPMNFMVTKSLRNAFKAKVSSQGQTIKDVLIEFMKEHING